MKCSVYDECGESRFAARFPQKGIKALALASLSVLSSAVWGGENLVDNGDFEKVAFSPAVGYLKEDAKASLGNSWKYLRPHGLGLFKSDDAPVWMLGEKTSNLRLQCGTYGAYMQTGSDAGDIALYQDVTVTEPGLYRFSAKFLARNNGYNGNEFSFSIGGTRLYSTTTTKTTFWQKFVRNVRFVSPGVYRIEAKAYCVDKDQMTLFDDFVLEKVEDSGGEPETPALVHRYSFNGSWADSVAGGTEAIPIGGVQLDKNGKTCTLLASTPENKNDHVRFGPDFLPVNGQLTLEFWFTENEAQKWSRLFHFGSGDTDCMMFALRQGGVTTTPCMRMTSHNGSTSNATGEKTALVSGRQYYIAVVAKPVPTERGGTAATAYLYDAATHERMGTISAEARDWLIRDFSQPDFFLGNSCLWNDADAKMTVDEFRVWNVAFDEQMISASVVAGPDAETLPDPRDAVSATVQEPWTGTAAVTVEDSVRGLSGTSTGSYTVSSASQTFAAPASATDAAGRTWVPAGYKLERYDSASGRWIVAKTGDDASAVCENTRENSQMRLTWHWKLSDGVLKYDADCYVPNGLLLHFDAVRNAGLAEEHSMDAETWANLGSAGGAATSGTKNQKGVGFWGKTSFVLSGGGYFKTPKISLARQATVQIGYDVMPEKQDVRYPTYFGEDDDGFQIYTVNKSRSLTLKQNQVNADPRPVILDWDGTFATAIVDGYGVGLAPGRAVPPLTYHTKSDSIGERAYYFAGSGQTNTRELTGSVYTLRVYDRVLTAQELARNLELDNIRFRDRWGESTESDLVTVRSSLEEAQCETGSYLVRGSAVKTFTAPQTVKVDGFTWTLKGYLLETMDTEARTVSYSSVDGVDTLAVTAVPGGANRRLTWRYELAKGYRTAADYDVGDYVQSGLVVFFDGIRNEGMTRSHNDSAIEWTNLGSLAGSAWFNCSRFHSWSDKGCVFSPAGNDWRGASAWTKDLIVLGDECTVQGAVELNTAAQKATWPNLCSMPGDNGLFFSGGNIQWKLNGTPSFFAARPSVEKWRGKYYTGILTPDSAVLTEGTTIPTASPGYCSGTATALGARLWSVGGPASTPQGGDRRHINGTTYAFRIYNRALTAQELVHNRKVDEARFHGALTVTNVFVAVNGEYAPEEPAGAYEVAGSWTFTAKSFRDPETRMRLNPRGLVTSLDGTGDIVARVRGGYTWEEGDEPVKLTWKWVPDEGFSVRIR